MGDKLYSNPPTFSNNMYSRAPCAKQVYDSGQQQYYTSYNVPVNNSFNQTTNGLEGYPMLSPQGCPKTQNVCMYSGQLDLGNWDNRLSEDALKMPDKIEMIEITSKDLSPASYCSNLDFFMPDFYKTLGKDLNYYNNGQWFNSCNNQKDFPSCAQVNQSDNQEATVKYCSIQKSQEFDYAMIKNYGGYANEMGYSDFGKNKAGNLPEISPGQDFGYYYDNKIAETLQGQFFQIPESYPPIDQQTEGSNEESDIIVEESDEEATDCNEFDPKKVPSEVNKCVICNVSYTPLGTQFYFLTLQSPLLMSSQKPVFTMLVNIVGNICGKSNFLCSECLGFVNTLDHLQLKLDNFKTELVMKFRRTCQTNNIVDGTDKETKKRKKFRPLKSGFYKCKLCKKILSLQQYCRNHLRKHKFRGFLCELCGKISPTKRHFDSHFQRHTVKRSKIHPFKCANCPKIFRTKSNRTEHENYCLGLLPYSCKFCDKKFPSGTKLKNHVRLKHDKKFIAICSICNIGFVKLSDYKSHKTSHSTDKKFACTKCEKTYKTASNLNFHMKVHSGKLPFVCNICYKGFMRKEYLEAHVNNHRGIKNFSCSICDKKFVSQKNLDCHLKYHDGSTKTRTCNVCGKVMTTGFEEHLRIHNNLREFECDQCEDRFNTKGTLAKHKKRKHSNSATST